MEHAKQQELLKDDKTSPSDSIIPINSLLQLKIIENRRDVEIVGLSVCVHSFDVNDHVDKAFAMVTIIEQGYATQAEIAKAFDCSTRTLRRYQRAYEQWGVAGFIPRQAPQKTSAKTRNRNKEILSLVKDGLSNRAIGRSVGCSETTVRNVLKRLGCTRPSEPTQLTMALPDPQSIATQEHTSDDKLAIGTPELNVSASVEISSENEPDIAPQDSSQPIEMNGSNNKGNANEDVSEQACETPLSDSPPITFDAVAWDRTTDRLFAKMGMLTDAAPLFSSKTDIPHLGVWLAIPALVQNGVLEAADSVYGCLGAAFYGLRTMVVTFVLMALLRIKHPEGVKEYSPQNFGRLLGLDRGPEVKTIRRKLLAFVQRGTAKAFGRVLAEHRAKYRGKAIGFLYVDGHVRVYHGKKSLPKTHIARLKTARPATSDYWVNDAEGEPLLVVPTEAHKHMVTMLPEILKETRLLIGERRATVVFDRAGWSPFKIANAKTRAKIKAQLKRITNLEKRRSKIPTRVAVETVVEGDRVIKLSVERKHLTDLFKMVAYQIESDLVHRLAGHYKRSEDEGRTLIQSALFSSGDLEVRDQELHVLLNPQSSPHRTKAIAAMCEELNQQKCCFPGTNMLMRYSVKPEPEVSMAYPGPRSASQK